ncbi:MAG: hypothetical protein JNM17_33560 [Archangium sp.]|nr:hypothetical protein [Archangium sp.]
MSSTLMLEIIERAVHASPGELRDVLRDGIKMVDELRRAGKERRAGVLARSLAMTLALRGELLTEAQAMMEAELALSRDASTLKAAAKVRACNGDHESAEALRKEAASAPERFPSDKN